MVDVQVGIPSATLHEQVDQPLEGGLLLAAIECPADDVSRFALLLLQQAERGLGVNEIRAGLEDAEEVVHAVVERERVALDVEEQVARRRHRQRGEAEIRHERTVVGLLRHEELGQQMAGCLPLRPGDVPAHAPG